MKNSRQHSIISFHAIHSTREICNLSLSHQIEKVFFRLRQARFGFAQALAHCFVHSLTLAGAEAAVTEAEARGNLNGELAALRSQPI